MPWADARIHRKSRRGSFAVKQKSHILVATLIVGIIDWALADRV